MAVEEGAKVVGKVSGITNFGVFVDLADDQTGLVHISQISNSFIKDIHDVLAIGDEVTAKVTKIAPDGKIALSMKAVEEVPAKPAHHSAPRPADRPSQGRPAQARPQSRGGYGHHGSKKPSGDFNAMLASFMKESDSRLSQLKRQTDGKRGGRGGRRS